MYTFPSEICSQLNQRMYTLNFERTQSPYDWTHWYRLSTMVNHEATPDFLQSFQKVLSTAKAAILCRYAIWRLLSLCQVSVTWEKCLLSLLRRHESFFFWMVENMRIQQNCDKRLRPILSQCKVLFLKLSEVPLESFNTFIDSVYFV